MWRKLSGFRCILKVKLSTFGDDLDMEREGTRGLNDVWTLPRAAGRFGLPFAEKTRGREIW